MTDEKPGDPTPVNGSDTANNSQPVKRTRGLGKPFKKGDPRINRLGRPKGFDEARKLMVSILNEKVVSTDGKLAMSRVQMIMMDWIQSRNFQKQKAALELAYGKGGQDWIPQIDLRSLSDAQLERLSKGEDIFKVLMHPND